MAADQEHTQCPAEAARFGPAAGVLWCVEQTGVRVFCPDGSSRWLSYPEAAVWDCVTRSASHAQATRLVSAVARIPLEGAADLVTRCLRDWVRTGMAQEAGNG